MSRPLQRQLLLLLLLWMMMVLTAMCSVFTLVPTVHALSQSSSSASLRLHCLSDTMKPTPLERHWQHEGHTTSSTTSTSHELYAQLSHFFVRAFWESKKKEICHGKPLTPDQTQMLDFRQYVDFRERYDVNCLTRSSEMLYVQIIQEQTPPRQQTLASTPPFTTPKVIQSTKKNIIACAGVECAALLEPQSKQPVLLVDESHTSNINNHHGPPPPQQQQPLIVPIMGDVAVAPSHRGQGIARELVMALEERVAQLWPQHNSLYLWVEASNTPARRLYQSLGYRIVHVENESVFYVPMDEDTSSLHAVPTVFCCMQKKLQ